MASDPRVQEALRAGRDEANGALALYRCRGDRRPVYLILAAMNGLRKAALAYAWSATTHRGLRPRR